MLFKNINIISKSINTTKYYLIASKKNNNSKIVNLKEIYKSQIE
jgi:hypothetical protein